MWEKKYKLLVLDSTNGKPHATELKDAPTFITESEADSWIKSDGDIRFTYFIATVYLYK